MISHRVSPLYRPSIHQLSILDKTKFYQCSFWVAWWVCACNGSFRPIVLFKLRTHRSLTFVSSFPRAFWCNGRLHDRSPFDASRDQIHHWFRLCCDSFFTWIFLRSFRHHLRTLCRTEMANVEQTQKMIPFITCEIHHCQDFCELVFGVNVFDLDLAIQIDSIKKSIKSNSVGSGNMSHRRAFCLYDHLDNCFSVFKHIQQSFLMWRLDV